jgi:hypothetical protein
MTINYEGAQVNKTAALHDLREQLAEVGRLLDRVEDAPLDDWVTYRDSFDRATDIVADLFVKFSAATEGAQRFIDRVNAGEQEINHEGSQNV